MLDPGRPVGHHGAMRITLALILGLLLAQVARAEPDSFGLGTGRDGVLTIPPGSTVLLGGAAPLRQSVAMGALELSVTGLKVATGDLVMIHTSIGLSPAPDLGSAKAVVLDSSVVGRWELARLGLVDLTTGVLKLTQPLRFAYAATRAQVLRVPEYSDVYIEAGGRLSVMPWDGRSGGILAMLVSGKLVNDGVIDADGAGFLGGTFLNHPVIFGCTGLAVAGLDGGSARGQGVAGSVSGGGSTGRGNLANGGGGGNCHNAGGGGGGHGGIGGMGGRSATGDAARAEGGLGGAALSYSIFDRFTFGGGGGAGEGNDDGGSSGGRGGGAVLIRANSFQCTGVIRAAGLAAEPSQSSDGAGGGGAGGAVLLRSPGVLDCRTVEAPGGRGGDVATSDHVLGPGGGGAGGRLLLQGNGLVFTSNLNPGSAGQSAFPGAGSHGATPSSPDGGPLPDGGPFTDGGVFAGTLQVLSQPYQLPGTPVITVPAAGEVIDTTRPRFEGTADTTGPVVHLVVDGREVGATVPGADGRFILMSTTSLQPGGHSVVAWAEAFGVASTGSTAVRFTTPQVVLADGGAVGQAVLVVPRNGDTTGPTPLFAGTTPSGPTVGVVIDEGEDNIVPVDLLGRFAYQVPDSAPLSVGVHKVTVHAHNEVGDDGPHSDVVGFEVVVVSADGGTGTDAGTADPAVPMMVVPAQDASVDPTLTFVGVALPGTSIRLELDGVALSTVTTDAQGVFRHEVGRDAALGAGAHRVLAQVVTAEGEAGRRSPEVGFQVRGPTNLDVGCGCGTAPAGMLGVWALVGLALLARRRARG